MHVLMGIINPWVCIPDTQIGICLIGFTAVEFSSGFTLADVLNRKLL